MSLGHGLVIAHGVIVNDVAGVEIFVDGGDGARGRGGDEEGGKNEEREEDFELVFEH